MLHITAPTTTSTASPTFGQLSALWYAGNAKRLRQRPLDEVYRILTREVPPEMQTASAEIITRQQVHALLASMHNRPGIRRATLCAMRRVYRWAIAEVLVDVDPTAGLRTPTPEMRTRVLDDTELRLVWNAVGKMGDFGRITRMLLVTGQRREEIAGLRWDELELDRPDGPCIVLPPGRLKSNCPHIIPLSDLALEQLRPRLGSVHVFATVTGRAFSAFSWYKAALNRRIEGIPHWTHHDLRRTMRTRLAALRIDCQVAELCIGHGKRGMARIYDQYTYLPEMRAAMRLWSRDLSRIVGGT